MTVLGIDYAWAHPDPAAIAAAGYRFVCRYLSRDPSKNLTRAEADQLAAYGIACVSNFEFAADAALGGFAQGAADARLALEQATAAGMPSGRPIYFSVDWDVTPEQEPAVTDYLRGAASVLGTSAVGEYSGYYPIRIARTAGTAPWRWQSPGWSGGQWDDGDTIRQTGQATVGGVQVDINQAMVDDYGQWTPGEDMTPEEHNMLASLNNMTASLLGLPWSDQGNAVAWHLNMITRGVDIHTPGVAPGPTPPTVGLPHLAARLDELAAAVAKLSTPAVDTAALAAALAPMLAPGATPPTAEQVADAVVRHLEAVFAAGVTAHG